MWHRFTERARRIVFFAQEEAGELGSNYVSTEHLLLGLVRENDSVAARILERLGVSLASIHNEVKRQVTRGDGRIGQDMQLTPRAKRVIDFAYEESKQLNNNYIGTEHLLLGLLKEQEGQAAHALNRAGAQWEAVRREVIRIQHETPTAESEGQRLLSALAKLPEEYQNSLRRTDGGEGIAYSRLPLGAQRAAEMFLTVVTGPARVDPASCVISLNTVQAGDNLMENQITVTGAVIHATIVAPAAAPNEERGTTN